MTNNSTDTPRTDAWECFSDPSYYDMARLRKTDGPKDFDAGYHLNNLREAVEVRDILNELERRAEKAEAEVSKLRDMVMDAAKRGDMMAANWRERAEKSEALIKQIHHYAGIIEGFQNPTDK